ncbi:MAG: hypothetical protein AB8H79_23110 [Myxococcota bacterium]
MLRRSVWILLSLCACAVTEGPDDDGGDDSAVDENPQLPVEESAVLLSDTDRLLRIAMTLKGTRPSIAEFEAVEADASALDGIVDDYLESVEFGATVRDIENEAHLVRTEFVANRTLDGAPELGEVALADIRTEEPLKLVEYVVMNDRPYTEILTMSGTVGTQYQPLIGAGIGDAFDPNGPEWQPLPHIDGRGVAGILTTDGWHARWASNPANAQRLRASHATDALICADYLTGDVQLASVDLTSEEAVNNAILFEPACVSCHQTMDPIANAMFGFAGRPESNRDYPTVMFDPREADDGPGITGRPIGYYGRGGDNLSEIAILMAEDTRLSSCAAQRYLSYITQTPRSEVPFEQVISAQRALTESDMSIKAMVKHIVLSDAFATSHVTDAEVAERVAGILRTRPRQLDRMFRDLTGFTWLGTNGRSGEAFVVPTSASRGFQVHGGGIEVFNKQTATHLNSASSVAFLRAFAAEAAADVVVNDFDQPAAQRRLLSQVELDTTDPALLRAQFVDLHLRIYGERVEADSQDVSDTLALFSDLDSLNSNRTQVWTLVLTAMLQDIRVATY